MRMSAPIAIASGLLAMALGACVGTPSAPPPYEGQDLVGEVDADMLIGNWSGRLLNAPSGQENNGFTATFSKDGKAIYRIDDKQSGMNLMFEMSGSWSIDGEHVFIELDSFREVSGNALGGMMASMMNGMRDQMNGKGNVFESTSSRLIIVGDGGEANEFIRQP